ncbi:hypothetical protein LCGC14_2566530 [marine sediment metagenome]|uniref:Uncharacterized protein n=1 Tax=marine sediment metagenome TaxID=412755 RepID=A0A0F9CUM3_9ZZZZ
MDPDPEIRKETDGTFTIMPDDFFDLEEPIKGIPTQVLAERIIEVLWDAERAGSRHFSEGEF